MLFSTGPLIVLGRFQRSTKLVTSFSQFTRTRRAIMAGEVTSDGLPLSQIVDELDRVAHPSYAESWDNVGLLIEPTGPLAVRRILLTNDLTEVVLHEALTMKANLVVSYHPPIFSPLKRVTSSNWKERIVAKCLENRIAVYSPHTAWDAVQGGVADWLAEAFRGHYDVNSVIPMVKPTEAQNSNSVQFGMGRILSTQNLTLGRCVELVKRHTSLSHVRLSIATGKTENSPVHCIALVPGSGGSLLKMSSPSPDLFVTGEMLHHDVLDAAHKGISIVLTNHSDSERGFLRHSMASKLSAAFNGRVEVNVSSADQDPLRIV